MAPGKKDHPSKGLEPDEILQAVVVADSFNERFKPLTLDRPRCLMPLANVPLIEYTLEFLALSGVQEVFVVCCAHSEAIKDYLRQSKWHKCILPRVSTVVSQELRSVGDALRDMDAKQLLHSDFILVSGDVVSNMNLEKALEEHRQRRATTDKNSIMTMVVKQASATHRSRTKGEESVFILDAATNECVQFESLEPFPVKRKTMLDPEVLAKHPELEVRNDLIDCQVDICNIEVPALFTENFDYQDMRRDFVRGILGSDILGKTIYCHVLDERYAARVATPQMYDAISKDVLARWTYPLVPDSNLLEGQHYLHSRPHIYKDRNVELSISAQLHEHVVVGSGTTIGDKTRISNSVIGQGCKIGANVIIDGAYIWDNVTIEDNTHVYRSIVGHNVTLKRRVVVQPGCMLGTGVGVWWFFICHIVTLLTGRAQVVVGPNITLPRDTRLTRYASGDDDDVDSDMSGSAESSHKPYDVDVVGPEGEGYVFIDEDFEDDEDEEFDKRNIELGFIGRDTYVGEADDDDDESAQESDDEIGGAESGDEGDWKREALQTLDRAISENHDIDIAALELNTLKMAMNITFHDLRSVVVPALVNMIDLSNAQGSTASVLKRWGKLIQKFTHGEEDQLDVLEILQDYFADNPSQASKIMLHLLRYMYDLDIVEEDAIFSWHASAEPRLRDLATPFVKWLKTADEESDEEDDDDEDSD
ncbi:hypothetical protein HK104_006059 [Borealophlyctis nickersoniae]|nr:hypothetical protein HK104_006059 [Borealophlyctis nickersoniae]